MSQFNYFNDMNSLVNLDGELRMQSKPRWQRKVENSMNGSVNASKLSVSYNNSYISAIGGNTTAAGSKTPNKSVAEAGGAKKRTPSDKKSPGKQNVAWILVEHKRLLCFVLLKVERHQQTMEMDRRPHREQLEAIASFQIARQQTSSSGISW